MATLRAWALPYVLLAASGGFLWWVNRHYPITEWLFWHYALCWVCVVGWAASCIAMGHTIVRRVLRTTLPLIEQLSTSWAVGAFAFFLAMNVLGHLQLYNGWTFFLLPLSFLAIGGRDTFRTLRRARQHLRHARRTAIAKPRPAYFWPAIAFGVIGLLMVYFPILSPDNVQFDSRWKHLALAEEFAAHGGLRRFDEGFTVGTYPHLSSYFYGWAWLCPKVGLFDHIEIAAHVEFILLIGQVIAIPGLVRLLVPGHRAHLSWVVRFLFPGFYLYDSSLSAGADHVGAFFVIPVATQLIRGWRELSWRHLVIMTVPLCGVGLTKYTCTILVLPVIGGAVAVRMVWALVLFLRKRGPLALRSNWLRGPLAALGAIFALTAVHWVKNWIWYGDPVYPQLHNVFQGRPWTQDAPALFEYGYKEYQFWRPPRTTEGVLKTLAAMFNFSFVPNDYSRFHGKVPTFGSLFTLLLVALPFLRRTWRIVGVAALVHLAILIWFWTHHQDRYLQAILPWMAAVTAAILVKLWWQPVEGARLPGAANKLARVCVSILIAAQAIWGGDVFFIQTHAMAGGIHKKVVDLLSSGYKKNYADRFKVFGPYSAVAKHLPKGARVLLHDNHVHTGIGATSVSDWGGWQFGLSYVRLGSPAAVWQRYREYGVTHVLWDQNVSKGWDTAGGDIVFFELATRHVEDVKSTGRTRLGRMPKAAPDDAARNDKVLVVGCDKRNYPSGIYPVMKLDVPVFGPDKFNFPKPEKPAGKNADLDDLAEEAAALFVDPRCGEAKKLDKGDFQLVAKRKRIYAPKGKKEYEIYLRKAGSVARPADDGASSGGDDDDAFDPTEGNAPPEGDEPEDIPEDDEGR